ncbi:hypothetical protein NQF87_08670, partial [Bombella sp. TMW 2.2559]|nr:hypothetical protein [Bombella dulcis]
QDNEADNAENAETTAENETTEATDGMDEMLAAMKSAMEKSGCSQEQIDACLAACRSTGGSTDNENTAANSGVPEKKAEDEDDAEEERKRAMATDRAIKKALAADRAMRRSADDALRLVRPLVGDVHGMDRAPDIYRYALRQSGMAMDSLNEVNEAGLKALVNSLVRSVHTAYEPAMAHDSAPLPYKIPHKL